MKQRITFTLDVDEQAWAEEYGLDPADVREDVRSYMANLLHCMHPVSAELVRDVTLQR
ncbi:hypothetical protein ACFXOY_18240 [Streptomyces niveus]|uniref:hypothetical protein n=1 Tax=Streptomyces niveus TaxID=193462 RepID=UPI003680C21D